MLFCLFRAWPFSFVHVAAPANFHFPPWKMVTLSFHILKSQLSKEEILQAGTRTSRTRAVGSGKLHKLVVARIRSGLASPAFSETHPYLLQPVGRRWRGRSQRPAARPGWPLRGVPAC